MPERSSASDTLSSSVIATEAAPAKTPPEPAVLFASLCVRPEAATVSAPVRDGAVIAPSESHASLRPLERVSATVAPTPMKPTAMPVD